MIQVANYQRPGSHYKDGVTKDGGHVVCVYRTMQRSATGGLMVEMSSMGLSAQRVGARTLDYMKPLQFRGKPYPLRRAARIFLRAGKRFGMTKQAEQLLRDALTKGRQQ